MEKNRKFKGSVLVVSLLVLGIVLIVALSVGMVTLSERKISIGETNSNAAFQNAQTGIENLMTAINDKNNSKISQLTGSSWSCVGGYLQDNSDSSYKMELSDETDTKLDCSVEGDISQIAKVTVVGKDTDRKRAIEFTPECYGSDTSINSGLVGRWKFDGDLDDSEAGNDGINCTAGLNNHFDINSSPEFDETYAEMPTGYIKFNDSGDKNCVMISHQDDYKLQEGTVSFWVKYNSDDSVPVFSKDADGCWTGTDPENTSDSSYTTECNSGRPIDFGNDECDCGHLSFGWNHIDATTEKLQVRFQNDGNGRHELIFSEAFPDPDSSNEWHLLTLTFTSDKYVLYVDGELDRQLNYGEQDDFGNDPDEDDSMEALLNNDWHIWLGASYGDSYAQADMDDLRIYSRPLSKCEIKELYREKGQ